MVMAIIYCVKMWISWNKNTEAVLDASKKVGLEVHAAKTKYISYLVTRLQDKVIV
jgi:hypothetical protein